VQKRFDTHPLGNFHSLVVGAIVHQQDGVDCVTGNFGACALRRPLHTKRGENDQDFLARIAKITSDSHLWSIQICKELLYCYN
jgi:hypothetical protein